MEFDMGGRWRARGGFSLAMVFFLAAWREYTFDGGVAVFLMLCAIALPFLTLTGRIITASSILGSSFVMLDIADRIKHAQLRQHLHHQDINIILQFVREGNLGFFFQYITIVIPVLVAFAIFLWLVIFCWRYECRTSERVDVPYIYSIILAIGALFSTHFFMSSSYMMAVRQQLPPRVAADGSAVRVSALLAAWSESRALSKTLDADRKAFAALKKKEETRFCGNCPDIVIIHLESVYDPKIEKAYERVPPLLDLIGDNIEKWGTSIRVNTWGGNSVVTEFEVMCSVNHELFSWGGLQPHINVSPFFKGCLGNELKNLGYKSSVLYSLNGSFSNVRAAFARYGFEDFRDFEALGLPKKWSELHDRLVYERLIGDLRETRKSPRAYFVSTNWNHGPHGFHNLPEKFAGLTERFAGPYDPAQADSPALADYVNRLNDSVTALNDLLAYARSATFPIVIMAYGDHHPSFDKNYSERTVKTLDDPDYYTPLMMFRNFHASMPDAVATLPVEESAYQLARFAGIAPLSSLELIHQIQLGCDGDQRKCLERDKSRLRAIHLEE